MWEHILNFRCSSVTTSEGEDIEFDDEEQNVLMVSCSEIEKLVNPNLTFRWKYKYKNIFAILYSVSNFNNVFLFHSGNASSTHRMFTKDCINATWFPKNHFGSSTNYSQLINDFKNAREKEEYRVKSIKMEADLVIYNRTK